MPTLILGETGGGDDWDREAAELYLDAMLDGDVPLGADPNTNALPGQPLHFAPPRLGGLVSGKAFELPGDFGILPGNGDFPSAN